MSSEMSERKSKEGSALYIDARAVKFQKKEPQEKPTKRGAGKGEKTQG